MAEFDWGSVQSRFAALGEGLQGRDAMAPRREYQAGVERDERKVNIAALMDNMGIGSNRRSALEMLPQQQQLSWLMGKQDSTEAANAASAEWARNQAEQQAAQAAFNASLGGEPTQNVAPQQNAWNEAVSAPLASAPFTGPQAPTSMPHPAYSTTPTAPPQPFGAGTTFGTDGAIAPLAMNPQGDYGVQNLGDVTEGQAMQDMPPQALADRTAMQGIMDAQPAPVMGGGMPTGDIGAFPSQPETPNYDDFMYYTAAAKNDALLPEEQALAAILAEKEKARLFPVAEEEGFRQATPEEAASYGAVGGQFSSDGRFYPRKTPDGMSISSDGAGGFTFNQGPGVTSQGSGMDEGATDGMTKVRPDYKRDIGKDDAGNIISVTDSLIKGSNTYTDMNKESETARLGLSAYDRANKTVVLSTQRAIKLIEEADFPITGWGSLLTAPGSKALELREILKTVGSATALGRLSELKATGATMGALNEREGDWLLSSNGSMEQSNSKEALLASLHRNLEIRSETTLDMRKAYDMGYDALGENKVDYTPQWTYTPPPTKPVVIDGYTIEAID